jgi:hypothetical protein
MKRLPAPILTPDELTILRLPVTDLPNPPLC